MKKHATESPATPDDAGPVVILPPECDYLRTRARCIEQLCKCGFGERSVSGVRKW